MPEKLSTEQVEEIHDDTLWSVNIQGPDDVFAARSRADAIELATKFNEWWVRTFAAKGLHPYDPTLWAVPTPWLYDEASHARSLADTEGEYAWLRDPSASSLATELLALRKRVGELEGALEVLALRERVEPAPTHRHKKTGGEYVLIGFGRMQSERWLVGDTLAHPVDGYTVAEIRAKLGVDMREVAIYSVEDGSLWVRPREEFEDGRFASLPTPKEPS